MIHAYLFINLDSEHSDENILDSITRPEILEKHRLYGTYDMVLLIEAESPAHLKEITLNSIRELKFVSSTMTMIALEQYYEKGQN